jgi:DNA-binding HxlR family transcriptional regulator
MSPHYPITDCDLARALEIVGRRWTLLIIDRIADGSVTFTELRDRLRIASNILSGRLRLLVDARVVRTETYEQTPLRRRYVLTTRGEELQSTLATLRAWGQRHAEVEPARPHPYLRGA